MRSVLCFAADSIFRKTLPPNLQKRVSFEAMSADEAMEDGESEGCEVLIVDPPRKVSDCIFRHECRVASLTFDLLLSKV